MLFGFRLFAVQSRLDQCRVWNHFEPIVDIHLGGMLFSAHWLAISSVRPLAGNSFLFQLHSLIFCSACIGGRRSTEMCQGAGSASTGLSMSSQYTPGHLKTEIRSAAVLVPTNNASEPESDAVLLLQSRMCGHVQPNQKWPKAVCVHI